MLQIWKKGGVEVTALDEHLISGLAPRMLAALATTHSAAQAEDLEAQHVSDVVAALGTLETASLMALSAAIDTSQRSDVAATVEAAAEQLATRVGENWQAVRKAVRRAAEERAAVRSPPFRAHALPPSGCQL